MKYFKIKLNELFSDCKNGYVESYIPDYVETSFYEKRDAIIICPGGAYCMTSDREAEPVAFKFLTMGYSVFVLRYTVNNDNNCEGCYPWPMNELERTIEYVDANKELFRIKSISLMGFSAGGHLASYVACTTTKQIKSLFLGYPVITMGKYSHFGSCNNLLGLNATEDKKEKFSVENVVSKNTPSTFIFTTEDDEGVPFENTLFFIASLRKNQVPFECHIYSNGPHGISLANLETASGGLYVRDDISKWPEMADNFFKRIK